MIDHDLSPQQRAELGDLDPLYDRLAQYEVPEPDSDRLLAALKPLLPHQPTAESLPIPESPYRNLWDWLHLARMQTQLLETPFWGATLLLVLLGLLLGVGYGSHATTLGLTLAAPLLAAAGVAYLFRPSARTLRELEVLSRVQPLELLFARLTLILALNITLALALLFLAWTQGLQLILWRLLLIWFGPMVGLSGLALFCSVRWNTTAGIIAPLMAWAGMIALGWREITFNIGIEFLSGSSLIMHIAASNTILLVAVAALLSGIILLAEAGRQVNRWH